MKTHLSLALVGVALAASSTRVAATPQTITPITTVLANDFSTGARFGSDVAIDGQLVVAGAWGDAAFRGSAYVLRGVAGNVTQEAKLIRTNGQVGDLFGRSVDVSGETIVVGASRAIGAEGRVVVFENTSMPASWTEVATLAGNDLLPGDEMGLRVAIDGDIIVAGAPTQAAFRGAAYVFRRVGGVWSQDQKLLGSLLTPNDLFGIDVCISGDRILVGACGFGAERGRVFVYERSGTIWSEVDFLEPQNPIGGDLFGISVSFDGGRAVVGASRNGGGTGLGFIDVYRLNQNVLSYEDTLESPFPNPGTGFGLRVDVSGDFIVASQALATPGGTGILYTAGQNGFSAGSPFVPAGVLPGDEYGGGVDVPDAGGGTILLNGGLSIQNRVIVGGARLADVAPLQAEGRVYTSLVSNSYSGFCQGQAGSACGTCPCSNAPATSPLAGGCLNSDGRSALLSASGSASLANDTLRFRVFNATSSSFALLQSGPNALPNTTGPDCAPGSGNTPLNFDGLRCIGGGTTRHGTRPSDSGGNIGLSTNGWGGTFPPAGGLLAQNSAVAGQTVYFQAFYRDDVALGCLTGQNTTNAVRVLCLP